MKQLLKIKSLQGKLSSESIENHNWQELVCKAENLMPLLMTAMQAAMPSTKTLGLQELRGKTVKR